jgi:glycosyltransferase involved in cell wall biosynthesis
MKNVLYIGNKLSVHGSTVTSIETLGQLLEGDGYIVRYASSEKSKVLRLLDMVLKTFRYSSTTDYVLIDTYSTSNFYYAVIISQLCRMLNLRYIPILHGGNLPKRLASSPKLCELLFKNSFVNIAPSRYLLSTFQNAGFGNITYVPNAITISNFPHKKREILAPKLLWVRSLAAIYNPKMAVEVLKLMKADFPDATLTMVGPDNEELSETLKNEAQKKNLHVTFTGRLEQHQWTSLSQQFDIFINTSRVDNTPYSLIEAAALGMPIVSTNVGGIPYLFKNGEEAILVENANALEMANAIRNLLFDKELSGKIAVNARGLAESFDWQHIRHKWIEILK